MGKNEKGIINSKNSMLHIVLIMGDVERGSPQIM
jgi:hypothetical protein